MVQRGELRMVQKMWQDGKLNREWLTQTDTLGWTALHWVISESSYDVQSRTEFAQLLLGAKALPNQATQAQPGCKRAAAGCLLACEGVPLPGWSNHNLDLTQAGNSPLILASRHARPGCTKALLEAKAEVCSHFARREPLPGACL